MIPLKMWLAMVGRERIEEETGKPVITSKNASQLNAAIIDMIDTSISLSDEK